MQPNREQEQGKDSMKRSVLWNIVYPGDPYDIRKYSPHHPGP